MKLKLVVASMSVLGLVSLSLPAFATTHHKHRYHHNVQKHEDVVETTAPVAYKGMPVEVCPLSDPYISIMDAMGQNLGRAKPTQDCMKLLSMAGGVNFDAKWGNRSMYYQGENVKRLSLNDAYLNLFGNVNDWTKAFASLSYSNASDTGNSDFNQFGAIVLTNRAGQYSNVYKVDTLTLEQGYAQISNFDQTPFFLKLGKFYQDFGRYTIHPITRSMTQVLSESLQTAAQVGFITKMGFHGDIYAFDNPLRERTASALTNFPAVPFMFTASRGHSTTDYGAALGFDQMNDQMGWGVNLGYLYNMVGVNDIAQAISQYHTLNLSSTAFATYYDRVSAGSVDAYITSGPFSLIGDYVSALSSFSNTDLGSKGISALLPGFGSGAKPWAANLQAGYGFNYWNKNQNLYVGYQESGDAVSVQLPKNRWVLGYNVDMWKNTNLGLQIDHDKDYSAGQGGTGNTSNLISFRAGVKFG